MARFRRLWPAPAEGGLEELLGDLRLGGRAPADRPYVVANFVASVDGRGPTLFAALVADGLVDELFLTVSPVVAGDDGPRLLEGALPATTPLVPLGVLVRDSFLFIRYQLG